MICSMLVNFYFHGSSAAIWTILSVPVEWNEEPSGVHRRRTRKQASEKCRFPRHPGFRKKGQDAGTSKNVAPNGKIGKYNDGGLSVCKWWPGGMRGPLCGT